MTIIQKIKRKFVQFQRKMIEKSEPNKAHMWIDRELNIEVRKPDGSLKEKRCIVS
ncbi:hypothetical protein KKC67_03630 [Patescibacteria group bacterium]|nr:hypothetical protein [Patescibacteria group bacterium]MBU0879869.1 hypothetical protein [Patescibacteria group bacterium]MBU1063180.1 hypothetical protein [Patescibacteria group bacterium]MBU1992070.1 hypothetical protein [Patescibacteria group bacterium]